MGNEFDEFFDLEEDPNTEQKPNNEVASPDSQLTVDPLQEASSQGSPVKMRSKLDSQDDFDDLFDASFGAASNQSSGLVTSPISGGSFAESDLTSEALSNDKSSTGKEGDKSQQDDLFADFIDEASSQAARPAATSNLASETELNRGQPDDLEDLFAEVDPSSPEVEEAAGLVFDESSAGLDLEYQQRKKKLPVKRILIRTITGLFVVGLLFSGLAYLLPDGFLGWKMQFGKKDEYVPPSATVLRSLNESHDQSELLIDQDRVDLIKRGIEVLEPVLLKDERHERALTTLAEALCLLFGHAIDAKSFDRVKGLIASSERYFPDSAHVLRAKARFLLVQRKWQEAEQLSTNAMAKNSTDHRAALVKAEALYHQGKFLDSLPILHDLSQQHPRLLRARYMLALALQSTGQVDEAQQVLLSLTTLEQPHIRSELELVRMNSLAVDRLQDAQLQLESLLKTRQSFLSPYDQGQGWRLLADIQAQQGDVESAIVSMNHALQADSLNHEHSAVLGIYLEKSGNAVEASAQLRKAVNLSPQNIRYLTDLGRTLRKAQQFDESVIEIKRALELSPENREALFELGLSERQRGLFDEAIHAFEAVLKQQSDFVAALVETAELYILKDNLNMAQERVAMVLELEDHSVRGLNAQGEIQLAKRDRAGALNRFHAALRQSPQDVDVLLNLGKAYLAMADLNKARDFLGQAAQLAASDVKVQLAMGHLYYHAQEFIKADEIFRRLIAANHRHYEARVGLAKSLIAQLDFTAAISELDEAVKYQPRYFYTKLQLGIAWREAGDLDRALENLRQAIAIRPESPETYFELERTHIYRNDISKAEEAMAKAIELDPTFAEAVVEVADYYRTRNFFQQATDYYLKAIAIAPRNPRFLVNLAELYKLERKYALARTYYQKTLAVDPDNALAFLGLGLLAEEDRDVNKAMSYYKRAIKSDPLNPNPYYYLGFIHKHLRQPKLAVAAFDKYLQLDPKSKERQDILDQIEILGGAR